MSLVDIRRACFDYMARREHSRYELKQKLLRKDFDAENIEHVLDEFQEKNLQCDARFCDAYLRMRMHLGFGPERIRMELKQKKIDSELIESTLKTYADDFVQAIQQAWQKKFNRKPSNIKEKAKQIRFLQYRGFSQSMIKSLEI